MVSGTMVTAFLLCAGLALAINFFIVPAAETYQQTAQELSVGQVGATNTTGNSTAAYNTTQVGLFGDPGQQLLAMLIILGVAGGIAAVAVFGTGAQPGPAAVVAFVVALALIMVNVVLAAKDTITQIPHLGNAIYIGLVAFIFVVVLMAAAKIMSGASGD